MSEPTNKKQLKAVAPATAQVQKLEEIELIKIQLLEERLKRMESQIEALQAQAGLLRIDYKRSLDERASLMAGIKAKYSLKGDERIDNTTGEIIPASHQNPAE